MDFQDFPKILGNLGVETEHPPKMCAGLVPAVDSGTVPMARRTAGVIQQQHSRIYQK